MPDRGLAPVTSDHEARRRALDPAASFLVQAPAGSGKTELLIQRFLALLARVDQPEAIVAITFTRKAAAEMRDRVLTALDRAARGEEGESASDRLTLSLAQPALAVAAARGWDIRTNPSRLRIQTIDSLCVSLVKRMPWLSRLGAVPEIVEDAGDLYREAARATIQMLGEEGAAADAIARLALHVDNDIRRLQMLLEQQLPRRDQYLRHIGVNPDPAAVRAQLEADLARLAAEATARLRAAFPKSAEARLAGLMAFARKTGPAPLTTFEQWRGAADLLLTTNGNWRKTVNVSQGFPPGARLQKSQFQEMMSDLQNRDDLLEELNEFRRLPPARFTDAQWQVLEALLTVLPMAAAQLKLVFATHGAVDFVEVGEAARLALGEADEPTDLALSAGDRIEHLLVDEVQDTSITQIELFERLIASWEPGGGRTLFLVGDPMQSIYKFRDAEVGLFLRIRQQGLAGHAVEPLRLTSNFRSRPEIVEWVNGVFSRLFPPREDVAAGAVCYSGSEAVREPAGGPRVRVHALAGADAATEAELVADLAEEQRDGHTAILLRARQHGTAIVAELRRRGIRYRAVDLDSLGERSAVRDLLALTRGLLHPGDRTAWLSILRAPWCGLTLAELLKASQGALISPLEAGDARFRDAIRGGLRSIRRVPLRQCVEETWRALGGPACLPDEAAHSDAARFFDLLDELDRGGEPESLRLLEERVAKLYAQPDPLAGDSLQIMTIHKAKGLEFDSVILPGLSLSAASDPKPLLRWAELPLDKGTGLVLAPVEASEDEAEDPIYAYLQHLDRRRQRHESVRLLYVAATRAREWLHLAGNVEVENGAVKPPRRDTFLHALWPAVEHEFTAAARERRAAQFALGFRPPRPLRRLPDGWRVPEPPEPLRWRPAEADEPVTYDWTGATLRHVGTVVHAALHRGAWTADWIRRALEGRGVPPAELEGAVATAQRALDNMLADERGRWILARREEEANEFDASLVEDGVVRRCVIDRTFVEDGIRWVIDYKTGSLEGGGVEQFLDNEVERYRGQMERYRRLFEEMEGRPVRLGLYFPLLRGWREW